MKKKILALSTVIIGLVTMSFVPVVELKKAPEWSIDKAHTRVGFEVNHFFTPVEGRFNDFDIKLMFDPDDLATSSVETTVRVESVYTANERRDNDLRSDNFFDAKKYPEIKFASTSFEKDGNDYIVNGDLTIKETTKSIAIPFKVLGTSEHPMRKNTVIIGLRGETTIKRTDYGVGTGDWMRTNVVGDEVTISIFVEASRKV